MHLPALLSASTLGDLLGGLHREGTTGLLELREIRGPRSHSVPGRLHRIHLRTGLVSAVETGFPVPKLGEILKRQGILDEDAVRRLLRRIQAGDFRAVGEILANDGLATEFEVRAGLRKQMRERLDALYSLEEASIGFHTARPVANAVKVPPLSAKEFLHGRPRLRDRGGCRRPPSSAGQPKSKSTGGKAPVGDARRRALDLLRLPDGAELNEVRRAFRKIAAMLHPDRLGAVGASERRVCEARFAELSAAYHLLVA